MTSKWTTPGGHELRWDARLGVFGAHCHEPTHQEGKQRCKCDRSGHKAPLGFLLAWLETPCESRSAHQALKSHASVLTYAKRLQWRAWAQASAPEAVEFEQSSRTDGSTDEPAAMP